MRRGLFYIVFLFSIASYATGSKGGLDTKRPFVVVIDPGHGGHDPGQPKKHLSYNHEKDINLKLALKVGDYLKENFDNILVIYTRTKDSYITLEDRVLTANGRNADLFLSIHCNSNPARRISGLRVHIHDKNNANSLSFANMIEQDLTSRAKRKSRGIMDAHDRGYNLYVLQNTSMPAVLVEVGFLSNPQEEKYLNSSYGQTILSSSIYRSVKKYIQSKSPEKQINQESTYKVQVLASTKKMDMGSSFFSKLNLPVEEKKYVTKNKTVYKYLVGKESNNKDAFLLQKQVQKLGFADAFVVHTNTF